MQYTRQVPIQTHLFIIMMGLITYHIMPPLHLSTCTLYGVG